MNIYSLAQSKRYCNELGCAVCPCTVSWNGMECLFVFQRPPTNTHLWKTFSFTSSSRSLRGCTSYPYLSPWNFDWTWIVARSANKYGLYRWLWTLYHILFHWRIYLQIIDRYQMLSILTNLTRGWKLERREMLLVIGSSPFKFSPITIISDRYAIILK